MSSSLIIKAADFAAKKHKFQKRKDADGTPYINHPIGVANIITEEGNIEDTSIIIGALLHDTVEDTDTTFEEIESIFGCEISNIVREVSDDKSLSKDERKQQQIDHAAKCSYKAKVVKLADKLYNLRDLSRVTPLGWTEERVQEYFIWSGKVINQILGTNQKLEEALKQLLDKRGVHIPS